MANTKYIKDGKMAIALLQCFESKFWNIFRDRGIIYNREFIEMLEKGASKEEIVDYLEPFLKDIEESTKKDISNFCHKHNWDVCWVRLGDRFSFAIGADTFFPIPGVNRVYVKLESDLVKDILDKKHWLQAVEKELMNVRANGLLASEDNG